MFYLHLVGNWCTTLYLDDRRAFFFLLCRKLCIVSQVWGYYSRLPNEWVMGTNRCCFLFLIDANETHTHNFHGNLRHSSHFITKSNNSASTNVLLASFTAQATGFFTRKFSTTEAKEGLNGVNRQPSNGLKINRQPSKTEYFYRQPSNGRAKISRQTSQISFNDRDRLT